MGISVKVRICGRQTGRMTNADLIEDKRSWRPQRFFAQLGALAFGAIVLGMAFVVSLVVFLVLLALALLVLGVAWWRIRSMRVIKNVPIIDVEARHDVGPGEPS